MPCNINGCPTKGDEPNIVLYPFPQESKGTLELLEQWRQYVDHAVWRRGRARVCSRHFPTPPTPTDLPTIDLPPDTENRKKYPERLVLRKKVSDVEMEKIAQKMLHNPEEFMDASKLKVGISGITYTKLWLLHKWRKHLSSYLIYRDAAKRAIRDAPEWMRRADDELQLVQYILQKDHLHEHSSFLRAVAGSIPSGDHASVVRKYRTTEDNVRNVWHLFSRLVRMKLQWLSCRGDVWRQLPRAAQLSPIEWEYSGQVIMDDDHVEWALIYSVSPLGRPILMLLHLAKLYKLEDITASRELRERRWAAACRVYRKSGLRCPPLLLQRRWQQLKQDARQAIAAPHKYRPHLYHWLLVCRWPHVVTEALPTWQQLRKRGFVYDLKEQDLEKMEPVEPEDEEDNEDILAFLKSIKFPDLQIDGEEDISKNLETHPEIVAIASKTEMIDHIRALNSKLLKYYAFHIVTYFSNIERENLKKEQHNTTSETKEYNLYISPLDEISNTYSYKKIQKTQNETSNDSSPDDTDNEAIEVIDTIKELESLDPKKAETTIIIESDEEMELCDIENNKGQIPMDVEEFQSKKHHKDDLEMAETYPMQAFKKPRLENYSIKAEPNVEDVKNKPNTQTDECNFSKDPVFVKKEKDSDNGVNKAKSRMRILFEDSSDSYSSDAESACPAEDVKVDEKLLMDTKVVLERVDPEQYNSSMNNQRTSIEQPNLVNAPKIESKCISSNPIQSYTSKLISEINSEEFEKSSEPLKQAEFITEPEVPSNIDIVEPIQMNSSPMQFGSNDHSDSYSDDFKLYLSDSESTEPIITEFKTKDEIITDPDVPSNKDIAEPIRTNASPTQFGTNYQSDSDSDDFKLYLCESDSESTQPIITKSKTEDEFQTSKLNESESKPFECEYEQVLAKLMQSGSEKVLFESKHILSESKQTVSESEHIQSESEKVQSEIENIHSESEKVKSEIENIQFESEHIQSESEKIQSEIENIHSESEHVQSESESAPSESYESRTISGTVESLLAACRPLTVALRQLSPQECAKSWSWADVGRPVSLPVRGQARLLPVAQVRPIRPDTGDDADKGGVCSFTTLQNMIQEELKDRTFVLYCCGARRLMELVDKQLNRKSVDTVLTAKQRHLEEHRDRNCRCCCRWLIRDSPPWFSSLLYSHRTLREALASVAKIRKDDDADKHPLFELVTLISSDDDNENTVIMKRKKYKYKRDKTKHKKRPTKKEQEERTKRKKRPTKKTPEEVEEEDTRPSTGDRDYDEWMRQKTEYKRFFFIKSMIGKSKANETTETETQADQSNIDAEKTQSNIAPTQESPPKTQSNIAPTQKSPKTQSNNVTRRDTYTHIQNPLLHIANVMEEKYKKAVFATSEKKAKSMAEDALELALKVTMPQKVSNTIAPLTVENVAFHTQIQDIQSGPSTSANIVMPQKGSNTIAPVTVENVTFHKQIQVIQSGPSISAYLNSPIVMPQKDSNTIAPVTVENVTFHKQIQVIQSGPSISAYLNSPIVMPQKDSNTIAPVTVENVTFHKQIQVIQSGPSISAYLNSPIVMPQKDSNTIAPLTVENVAFHSQIQDIQSGPSTSAYLNSPIVRKSVKLQNCINVTPVQANVQKPVPIARKPRLIYLGKSVNPTGQPSNRPIFKLLQKVNMPQVLQNNTSSKGVNNVVFTPANMPSVLEKYTQNYTPLEQAQVNLTQAEECILPTTEPATVIQNSNAVLTKIPNANIDPLLKSSIQNFVFNRSLLRSTTENVESHKSLFKSAVQNVESNIIKCISTKNCTQKNAETEKPNHKDVYVQIPATKRRIMKLPNILTVKRVEQNQSKISITQTKYNVSNQKQHTLIKIKRGDEDTRAALLKNIPSFKTLCRDGKPIARVISPFVSNVVEKRQCVPVMTCGTNLKSGRKPMEFEPVSDITDRSELPEDDANDSGRNSPDVVLVTKEPEVVDLTDENDDTRRYFVSTTPEKCTVINEIIPLDAPNAGHSKSK